VREFNFNQVKEMEVLGIENKTLKSIIKRYKRLIEEKRGN